MSGLNVVPRLLVSLHAHEASPFSNIPARDMMNAGIGMKKYVFVGIGTFFAIVLLAVCISARFSLTNITADPYKFIEGFFDRWSTAPANFLDYF